MDEIDLSEFEKISSDGVIMYFKHIADVEGILYDVGVVFGKTEGQPYQKIPMRKVLVFVVDKQHILHERWWNEQGYHTDIDDLPHYDYFICISSQAGIYSPIHLPALDSLKPFFGDIKK